MYISNMDVAEIHDFHSTIPGTQISLDMIISQII